MNNKLFYQKSIKEYGVSAQGVHWNNKYTQYKRFEVITKFIKKDIKDSTIIDAGCGFGEYYNYLKINHKIPLKYIGIDMEDFMVKKASKRFNDVIFYTKDILNDTLEVVDYYVCSGALNTLNKDDFFRFITKCFLNSSKGFVFNFLKKHSFNHISTSEVKEFCLTLCDDIKTKENYLDNDFTIFMVKSPKTLG
jgi:SAM-dependent methyltransferase